MGFFSRLATFFRIRANAALDKAENPGQVMDYSYSKQLEQLQNLRRSIADVAVSCGFATQAHLHTAFKQRLGVTPGEFRRG